MPDRKTYRNRPVAMLTKHDKAGMVAPALSPLGLEVLAADGFDTDTLGTFSGEVERTLSPLECARRKARLACELTGLPVGLGSEGSFGGGPVPGLINWDEELLVLYDARDDFEIVALASGPVKVTGFEIESLPQLEGQLAGFDPGQAWIIRSADRVVKGLPDVGALQAELAALNLLEQERVVGGVRIEPDLRAMHCPERQAYIQAAAQQLAERLQTFCPACTAPDFWQASLEQGLPCGWCGEPSEQPLATIRRCRACGHEMREPVAVEFADPGHCQWCNP